MTSIEHVFGDGKGALLLARSAAAPSAVWRLLAAPRRWPDWAPHIVCVEGEVTPIVRAGAELTVRGPGGLPVRTVVTHVAEGRRWDFDAQLPGPFVLTSAHEVRPQGGGAEVGVRMRFTRGPAAALLDRTALMAYLPLAAVAVRRLARLAERS